MNFYLLKRRWALVKSLPLSLYFNLHYLPFKQAIKLPIILYNPSFWALKGKIVIDSSNINFGMIRLGLFNASINKGKGFVWMNEAGMVIFRGSFSAGPGSVIKISHPRAVLDFGNNVGNASSLKIDCHKGISIGENSIFGWDVVIMDSNLHRLKNSDGSWTGRGFEAIDIGSNCWLSSQTVVLPGTKFPSYSVCALGSILNKDYSGFGNGLFAGRPAKMIKPGVWRDVFDCEIEYEI